MMRFLAVFVVVVSTGLPVANTAPGGGGVGAPSGGTNRLAVEVKKTYCEYKYYNKKHFYCTDLPPAEAKTKCEKQGEEKHKEKIACWCTNEPRTTRNLCKKGQKGGQKPLSANH